MESKQKRSNLQFSGYFCFVVVCFVSCTLHAEIPAEILIYGAKILQEANNKAVRRMFQWYGSGNQPG